MATEQRKPGETAKEQSMRMQIVKKILELMTAAFSLVAALAWNDAIQSLFTDLFGPQSNTAAKFVYALIVTTLIVWIVYRLSRITKTLDRKFED